MLISETMSSTVFKVKTVWEKSSYWGLAVSRLYTWDTQHRCNPKHPSFVLINTGLLSWLGPVCGTFRLGVFLRAVTSAAACSPRKMPAATCAGCKSKAETTCVVCSGLHRVDGHCWQLGSYGASSNPQTFQGLLECSPVPPLQRTHTTVSAP